ncbi:RNA polymerase sigma factor [Kibdelosporangium lantanae]
MTPRTGEQVSDAELAARFQHDREVFTEVHDRYFAAVHRYVAGRLDAQVAEDITAETFLVAYDRRDSFDPRRGELRPWLFGIATNLVAGHRRKEARHYRALARLEVPSTVEGHENKVVSLVTAQRLLPRLAEALTRLSRGERDVLLLVALGGLSYDEVAQALGTTSGTVGSRLTRTRQKLSKILGQGDGNE